MNNRKQFEYELNTLLRLAEKAIAREDKIEAYALSMEVLDLVGRYKDKLKPRVIREVLNNPVASSIAQRLGVEPKKGLS